MGFVVISGDGVFVVFVFDVRVVVCFVSVGWTAIGVGVFHIQIVMVPW